MTASYDVKFWDTRRIGDTSRGRWRVRWAVDGRGRAKSFTTRELADGFLSGLKDAARDRQPFDPATGLPATAKESAAPPPSLYQHGRAYADMKWPALTPTRADQSPKPWPPSSWSRSRRAPAGPATRS